jgi:hypothetical protein
MSATLSLRNVLLLPVGRRMRGARPGLATGLWSALSLVLAGTSAAAAQTIPSPYRFIDQRHEAGLFVSVVPEVRGSLDIGPGGGLAYGARYSIELGGPFALEATSFLLPTDRQVRVPSVSGVFTELGDVSSMVAGADARVRFGLTGARTWNGLAPFLLLGGGVAGDLYGRRELEAELPDNVRFQFGPSFLGTLGAGTRWLPFSRVTVRLDAQFHLWKVGTPAAFLNRNEGLEPLPDQEWLGVPAFTTGLSYRF